MHSVTSLFAAVAGLATSVFAQDASSVASASSAASSATLGLATSASSATSTFSQSNVPTGTPLPGNYGGEYRPQVHFSPPQGFVSLRIRRLRS